jgi:hypothetical protein
MWATVFLVRRLRYGGPHERASKEPVNNNAGTEIER